MSTTYSVPNFTVVNPISVVVQSDIFNVTNTTTISTGTYITGNVWGGARVWIQDGNNQWIQDGNQFTDTVPSLPQPVTPPYIPPTPDYTLLAMQQELEELRKKVREQEEKAQTIEVHDVRVKRELRLDD